MRYNISSPNTSTYAAINAYIRTCRDEVIRRTLFSVCVWTCSMCWILQKVCFCWRLINPRPCWCLEFSHPQGKSDSNESSCNMPAGLSGYVNPWLCMSGRGCAGQRACYIETSCVMLQNSLFGWCTITSRVLVASHLAYRCTMCFTLNAFWTGFTSADTQHGLRFAKLIALLNFFK